MFRRVYNRVWSLGLVAAIALGGCGKSTFATASSSSPSAAGGVLYDPHMYAQMRAYGFIWTEARVPTETDGRPRVYRVSLIGKSGSATAR